MSENNLKHWQDKIKEKRKTTDFREFLMHIPSWSPIVFNKVDNIISRYPMTDRIGGVLPAHEFEESRSELVEKGINYDNQVSFFSNFQGLMKQVDFPSMMSFYQCENSDYSDITINSRNAYLSIAVIHAENVLYSCNVKHHCTNIISSVMTFNGSENCYMTFGVIGSFNIFYSKYINNSSDIWMSSNLNGCKHCILCSDLDNMSYCIENKQYTKEAYLAKKSEILSDKNNLLTEYRKIKNTGENYNSNNCSGSNLVQCENVTQSYNCNNTVNGRNLILVGGSTGNSDIYDTYQAGGPTGDDFYGVCGGGSGAHHIFMSSNINGGSNIFYGLFLEDCSYCIGCIGLKNKSYCILNKQYSKEEWYKRVDEIFSQMEGKGILGDFFPGELNPFYYNDTIAGLIGGFSKQEVTAKGYMWRNEEIKVDIPDGVEVIGTEKLDDFQGYDSNGNFKINPEILGVVIKDEKGNYYRIIQQEYDFLVKHSLPIPEIHWMDRMKLNFGM